MDYEQRLNRVTGYIHEHLDDELDFARLSEVACLSPYHWHRIYHAVRGETIAATIRRLRLQRAAADLAQSERRIDEIATRAGYGSVQAFGRAFADAYGTPPARYREEGSHADFRPGELTSPTRSWTIEIRQVRELQAVSLPHKGSYMEIDRAFEMLFGRLMTSGRLPDPPRMLGIYYDDPSAVPESELRSRAAVVGEGPGEAVTLRGGDYAVLRHRGAYSDMRPAYLWLYGTWLPQSGREADDAPVLEEYLNDPRQVKPSDLLTDILLPLRPL